LLGFLQIDLKWQSLLPMKETRCRRHTWLGRTTLTDGSLTTKIMRHILALLALSSCLTIADSFLVPHRNIPHSTAAMQALAKHFREQPRYGNVNRPSTASSQSHTPPSSPPPIPVMPSNLFQQMAQSQLELLANSLSKSDNPAESKVQSMILYLPAENVLTGQLEFTPAVLYPDPNTERVFIASDAASGQAPTLPRTLTKLPGFSHASSLLPGYPMLSPNNNQMTPEVGVVEEVLCDIRFKTLALSVPLLRGSQTVGVLLVSPAATSSDGRRRHQTTQEDVNSVSQWTEQDKAQVSRAAQSLSMALMMDQERRILREQNTAFREGLSDSLHQVKNPIQALRTYGKILQTQIAETRNDGAAYGSMPQLLELAERLMLQSERVVDLLQPMDRLVDSLDERMVLLPPAQNDTSQSMVLWGDRNQPYTNGMTVVGSNETDLSGSDSFHSILVGDFALEMMFVTDVLEPVFETFQVIATEHGIQFKVVVEDVDEIPGVLGSPLCLQEAVTNVLDNAFKYAVIGKLDCPVSTNPCPQVFVRIAPNGDDESGVSIIVQDNGPGIAESDQERVFQRGYRGPMTASLVEGRGIGLDISRALIHRMGGKLEIVAVGDQFGDSRLDGAVMKFSLYRKCR
jgi:signal transduction histidine kinase